MLTSDRFLAAVEERRAHLGVGELRAADERLGAFVGRRGSERRLHDRVIGPEPLAHPLERERQPHLLELWIDRRVGGDRLPQGRQPRIRVLAQALGVRFRSLVGRAHDLTRVREEIAVEPGAAFEPDVRNIDVAPPGVRLGDVVPGAAGAARERRIVLDERAQLLLVGRLLVHQPIVEQREELLTTDLDAVFDGVEVVLGRARRFRRRLRVLDQPAAQLAEAQQPERKHEVAFGLELRDGQQPLRRAGMPGDEDGFLVARAGPVELEMRRRRGGLAVLVGAQQRHVETPARELEVVRVAAEGRDRLFRRKRQAHIVIALVLVEPVLAALIERHAFALERRAGLLRRLLAPALERRSASRSGCGRRRPAGPRRWPS